MHNNAPQHKQKGFSLIEALVAFLILSVGMLGIASLQVVSMKAGQTAAFRTVAVSKAEEILEMMRSNNSVLATYAAAGAGTDNGCNDYSGVTDCNAAQLAAYDVFKWRQGLKDALPDDVTTTAILNYTAPVPNVQPLSLVTVTINWQERNPEADAMINMGYSTSLQMLCDNTLAASSC